MSDLSYLEGTASLELAKVLSNYQKSNVAFRVASSQYRYRNIVERIRKY